MHEIANLVSALSGWVWGPPMLVLLVGTGLYLTILLRGVQFRALPHAFRLIFRREEATGDITHFGALMTALAATVGTGNIVGVATAIWLGGPGAVFWMWVTGLVGMATKYAEAVLAVKYRVAGPRGMSGGPMYYLARGAGLPWLGVLFAVFASLAAFGIGDMAQSNAVAGHFATVVGVPAWITGVVLMIMTGLVIIGGIKSISRFASVLVPVMIVGYVIGGLWALGAHIDRIPHALALIFTHAFTPISATGGFAGAAVAGAIRYGIARGVFSNESGLGSSPIAAAAAKTNDPTVQALVSMTQTFIDTLVVCSMTALVILITDAWREPGITGAALTSKSFVAAIGPVGGWLVLFANATFAYSTLIGWVYYGEKSIEYLLGPRAVVPYRILSTA
ncbi:MAG: sodium:alanine symporter family protein, partial [bacterium]|nr:sodium:alanine symporter family protein [bacterium]